MKDKERNITTVSEENIYLLNGRVPLGKAIPFGLQHVLAMFVANLAPVLIVCSAALVRGTGDHLTAVEITRLLQCAMFVAGIGTCLQLYPIWKIGSKLPIVMGVSFTFLGSLLMICTNPDLGYEGMVGAVILGGIFEGVVGLSAQYWKKYLTPVVSSCVVIAIGLSLLPVGMNSWGGGSGSESFGSWYHLLVGLVTLIVCLVSRYLLHGVYKNLNILVGLIFGYILSAIFTVAGIAPMIDFSGISKTISEIGFFSLPRLVFFTGHTPVFDLGAFFTIAIVFLVSAAETTGATTAVCKGSLDRDIKIEELQGSLAVDGFSSTISGCFGCLPLTSFSQNVGLVTMTGVINRFTILMGALILILASLFPPLGAFFNSLPQSVLGGCTVMMFGSILYEGIKMLKDCEVLASQAGSPPVADGTPTAEEGAGRGFFGLAAALLSAFSSMNSRTPAGTYLPYSASAAFSSSSSHVPSGQPAAPAHPQQHAGKKSLRQQRIGTMQQPLQNKFHQSVQNRYLKQCLDEPHRAAQLGAAVKHAPVHGAANHILHRHGRCDGIAGNLQNALITRQNIQL